MIERIRGAAELSKEQKNYRKLFKNLSYKAGLKSWKYRAIHTTEVNKHLHNMGLEIINFLYSLQIFQSLKYKGNGACLTWNVNRDSFLWCYLMSVLYDCTDMAKILIMSSVFFFNYANYLEEFFRYSDFTKWTIEHIKIVLSGVGSGGKPYCWRWCWKSRRRRCPRDQWMCRRQQWRPDWRRLPEQSCSRCWSFRNCPRQWARSRRQLPW